MVRQLCGPCHAARRRGLRLTSETASGGGAGGAGTVLLWYSYELGVPSGFTTAVDGVPAAVTCVGVSASRRAHF